MNLKTLFSIVVALVCTAGISPAFTQNVRANGETLNVQTFPGATLSIHAIIAEKKGFCKKYNFTCELRPIANGTVALQSLIGKTVDVAMIGTEMIANAVAEGADLKDADSARCRPAFRDDLAHHSDLKSPTHSEMMSPTIPG